MWDAIERCGIAAALIAVTALTRYVLPDSTLGTRRAAEVVNFAPALPLLALALAPLQWRRLRRGLRAQRRAGRIP